MAMPIRRLSRAILSAGSIGLCACLLAKVCCTSDPGWVSDRRVEGHLAEDQAKLEALVAWMAEHDQVTNIERGKPPALDWPSECQYLKRSADGIFFVYATSGYLDGWEKGLLFKEGPAPAEVKSRKYQQRGKKLRDGWYVFATKF